MTFFLFCFRRVGIDNPTIEVRFENLNIDAEAYVGNRGVPTMTNFFSNKVMVCISSAERHLDASYFLAMEKEKLVKFLRLLILVICSSHRMH